jgi:hypothetical protein
MNAAWMCCIRLRPMPLTTCQWKADWNSAPLSVSYAKRSRNSSLRSGGASPVFWVRGADHRCPLAPCRVVPNPASFKTAMALLTVILETSYCAASWAPGGKVSPPSTRPCGARGPECTEAESRNRAQRCSERNLWGVSIYAQVVADGVSECVKVFAVGQQHWLILGQLFSLADTVADRA